VNVRDERAAVKMDERIDKLADWLLKNYTSDQEEEWLESLSRYERLCTMRDTIQREVLDA
jgi:hypothetical protein